MAHGIRLVTAAIAQAEHPVGRDRSHIPGRDRRWPRTDIHLVRGRLVRRRADLVQARDRAWWAVPPDCRIAARRLRWVRDSTATLHSATLHFPIRGFAAGLAADSTVTDLITTALDLETETSTILDSGASGAASAALDSGSDGDLDGDWDSAGAGTRGGDRTGLGARRTRTTTRGGVGL